MGDGVRTKPHRTKPDTDKTPQDKTPLDKTPLTTGQNPTLVTLGNPSLNHIVADQRGFSSVLLKPRLLIGSKCYHLDITLLNM